MLKYLLEKVDNIGQIVGINYESKGFGQNDDSYIVFEVYFGQGSQYIEKVSWINGLNYYKNKEMVKMIIFI